MNEADALAGLPRRPPTEVEWEDLLLRIELMPKALRVAMEDADPACAEVRRVLRDLTEREQWATRFLEHAAGLAAAGEESRFGFLQTMTRQLDAMDRFVQTRNRNFAIAQRRGLDIWEWEAPIGTHGQGTVYQLFAYLAGRDAASLAALRAAAGRSRVC